METMNTDTPETKDAYQQRDGEGAMAHEIRRAQTMEKLERERDELLAGMQIIARKGGGIGRTIARQFLQEC